MLRKVDAVTWDSITTFVIWDLKGGDNGEHDIMHDYTMSDGDDVMTMKTRYLVHPKQPI